MPIYLMANKNSQNTTVSIDDIRSFIGAVEDMNQDLKQAKQELKKAIDGDIRLEELKLELKAVKESMKKYVEEHNVYKEYLQKVEQIKEEKKDLIADAKEKGIPKKEIDLATKALKQDIDMSASTEIYANIADLVEQA